MMTSAQSQDYKNEVQQFCATEEGTEQICGRELIADIFPDKKGQISLNVTVMENVASLGEIEEQDSENEISNFPKLLKANKQPSQETRKDNQLITFIRDEISVKYRKPLQPQT